MKRKYIFLWCASFLAAGIFFASFFEFSLFGGGLFLFLSLMGILSGRVFGKTGAVWVCGALFLCAAGAVRMEMAEEIWRQQSQYIVGSEGTFCGIVAEEPLVDKGEDGYARYLIDLRKIRYADGEEKAFQEQCTCMTLPLRINILSELHWKRKESCGPSVYIRIRGKSIWKSATKAGIS